MAAVTFAISDPDTANASSYACTTFTPAVDDLLVIFAHFATSAEATGAVFACTDDQSGTYTKVAVSLRASGGQSLVLFVRDQLVTSAVGHIATVTCTGDASTGEMTHVYRVSGMSKTGATAVRQSATADNRATGTTPAPVFGITTLTTNPVLGAVQALNTPAVIQPSGWTEGADDGIATPTAATESCFINSGFVGTTVTWGGVADGGHGDIIVELDASAAGANVTPTTVAATVSVPTPAVRVDVGVTPSTVTATVSIPTQDVDADAAVTPATVTATATISTPDVTSTPSGVDVFPDTFAVLVGIPEPTVTVDADVTPSTVTVVVSIPTPGVAVDADVTPPTVAVVVSVPTPTVGVDAEVTLSTVAVTVSVSTPTTWAGPSENCIILATRLGGVRFHHYR